MVIPDSLISCAAYQIFIHDKQYKRTFKVFDSNGDCNEARKVKPALQKHLVDLRALCGTPDVSHMTKVDNGKTFDVELYVFYEG